MARMIGNKRILRKVVSVMLAILFVLGAMPPMALDVFAADETFSSGAVYLDADDSGKEIIIQNGVFSVTVNGATDITIIFDNVTINRRTMRDETGNYTDSANGSTIENLYYVSQQLEEQGKAQVCPFLITGNAEVTAQFRGTCTFYAGTNGCTVSNANVYTATANGGGYAGIQVQSGSTLIIDDATDLTVYGGVQHAIPNEDGNITVNGVTVPYSDVLRANADIQNAGYNDPFSSGAYTGPNGRAFDSASGGAGIGGGVWLDTNSSASGSYTNGTPGTIIINKGNIEAWGGVQAAGIGGGVNSAATTGMIQINGGNITAHGGRFGAGIGDGDSVNGNTSTAYRDAHSEIEINGGNITVYGGVASPGIGSSDEVSHANGFGTDTLRDMSISINAGNVNAFSGFPKQFNGNSYPTDAPAAIGAGSLTRLPANSIYISSASTQLDASFSNYAITENGSQATAAPTINVDSDGYLFLLRTGNYYSSGTRKFELYLPLKEENPNITGQMCTIYVDQTTHIKYYVAENGDVYDEAWNGPLEPGAVPDEITLFVDPERSEKIKDIEVAYYFRSVAITLPHPSLYGGIYALTVPTEGVAGNLDKPTTDPFISITIDAQQQGTQSGVVTYPSKHNLDLDATAAPFKDLDVYDEGKFDPSTNGLIGDNYKEKVYAYTVYIDALSNKATLYALYESTGIGTSKANIYLDDALVTPTGNHAAGTEVSLSLDVDMTGVTQKTVRLKKIDGNHSIGAISYKITIIKRGSYILDFEDADKIYDGKPLDVNCLGVFEPADPRIEGPFPEAVVDPTPQNISYSGTIFSEEYTSSNMVVYTRNRTYYAIAVTMGVEAEVVTPQGSSTDIVVNYVVKFNVTRGNNTSSISEPNFSMGWQVTYNADGTVKDGANGIEQLSGNGMLTAETTRIGYARNNTPINVEIDSDNRTVSITSSTHSLEMFSLPISSGVGSTKTDSNQSEVYAQAQAALSGGATSGTFTYETYELQETVHPITVTTYRRNNNNTANNTVNASQVNVALGGTKTPTGKGSYEIVSDSFVLVSLPASDLEHIEYTYQRIKDADGNTVVGEPETTTAPIDAGTYLVKAKLERQSYVAHGELEAVISKRAVIAVQIENWLLYISSSQLTTYDGIIHDPGDISISNVVDGDDVTMLADAAAGKVYYNTITVGYAMDKISIVEPYLQGADIVNYYIQYTNEAALEIRVFGQIAYDMTGAMFLKTETGMWRKYLDTAGGVQVEFGNADYQSPAEVDASFGAYRSHAQYVMARTENEGSDSGRYAIDIEYGELQYSFYHSHWNVNTLEYQENELSHWDGNDGSNNKVTIINYSNYQIQYQISAEIFFLYAPVTPGSQAGISAKVTTDIQGNAQISQDAWIPMDAAIPGDHTRQGTAAQMSYYIYISGTPQMSDSTNVNIGDVTLKFKPVT